MRRVMVILALLLVCASGRVVKADMLLEITSPDDLSHLVVGQSVTIDVKLAGLQAGDQIDLLTVDILVPSNVFSAPTLLTAGSIIPTADIASTFFAVTSSNRASAIFDDLASFPGIASNGTFLSFQLAVQHSGTGQIEFDINSPPQISGVTATLNAIDSIQFSSPVSVAAVPETSLMGAFVSLFLTRLLGRRCQRRFPVVSLRKTAG